MTKKLPDAPYTLRGVEKLLGVGRGVVRGLIGAGILSPSRGARNAYRFTFRDVVLLRMALQLKAAKISHRQLIRSLLQLKATIPVAMPLSGLRIKAIGNDVAVLDASANWQGESGQLLMDFELASLQGAISVLQRDPSSEVGAVPGSAAEWYEKARSLEEADVSTAEGAYRKALALAPDHADAYVNLGALLCEAGRCQEAVAMYEDAVRLCPHSHLLHFNRAIALEDQQRLREALASYQRCILLAPELADAHYNAARLHEKLGDPQAALRHYSAYRRLNQ